MVEHDEAQILQGVSYREPFRWPTISGMKQALGRKLVRWGLDMQPDGGLVGHARTELGLAGWLEPDAFYGDMMGSAVIDMMKLFAMEGHSGMSAGLALSLFEKVGKYEPLTPLTGADDEWVDHGTNHGGMRYQNRRCGHVFKDEDGSTYDIDGKVFREPNGSCFTSLDSRVPVTFPYTPKTEYVDVPASDPA